MRTSQRNVVLPRMRALHWAKRGFERMYLRRYR
jgi:sulfide:quinone oxidoreductase